MRRASLAPMINRKLLILSLFGVGLALVSPFLPAGMAHAATTEQAISWLRSAQRPDGTWAGDGRLVTRDTVEAVKALKSFEVGDPYALTGLSALMAGRSLNSDVEGRRLALLRDNFPDFILSDAIGALLHSRNPDGGWGFDGTFSESTSLETALALRAIGRSSALTPAVVLSGLTRLSLLQNPDGGFARGLGEVSEVAITAEVLLTLNDLAAITNVDVLRSSITTFLFATKNLDGGFPAVPGGMSDVTSTSIALQTLLESGVAGSIDGLIAARDYLRAFQSSDGSWLGDAYTTALALQVVGSERPDLALTSAIAVPVSVEQGTPTTLTIAVSNRGLADAPATTLNVYTGDPVNGGSLLGTRSIAALIPGQSRSEVFVFDTAPFLGSVTMYSVVDPSGSIAELTETNNRKVAIVVVRAPGSPVPTAGNQAPIITSVPPRTAIVDQAFVYQMSAVDPEGGAVTFGLYLSSVNPPPGMTCTPQGLVTWVPTGQLGIQTVNVFASDSSGALTVQHLILEVISPNDKRAPKFDSVPVSASRPGGLYSYTAVVEDPDGGNVTVAVVSKPPAMVYNTTTRTLSWTPTENDLGEHVVRLLATDDEAQVTEQSWIITVSKPTRDAIDVTVLAIDAKGAIANPQSLKASGTVRVTVANQGPKAATNVLVAVGEDRDGNFAYSSADGPLVGTQIIPQLAPGATVKVDVAITGTLLFRDNRLWGLVDPNNTLAESREDNNSLAAGEDAKLITTQGAFDPKLKWLWQEEPYTQGLLHQVWHPPVVIQLNDDNGDGHAGEGDVPDIIFVAGGGWDDGRSRLGALNGRTGKLELDVPLFSTGLFVPAVGDLDGDGFPEIVIGGYYGLIAYSHTGKVLWSNNEIYDLAASYSGGPIIADLDADGLGEVFFGSYVFEHNGSIRCRGDGRSDPGANLVVDLDLDGSPELIFGASVMRANCGPYWAGTHGYFTGTSFTVGQFDSDPYPEIISIAKPLSRIYEHDGTLKTTFSGLPQWGSNATIADFDGDGQSEIAVLTEGGHSIVEADGTIRWTVALTDETGPSEVASAADFDGDGRAELFIQDPFWMTLFDGLDGHVLWRERSQTGTVWDHPTIADIDGDGRLDMAVAGNIGGPGITYPEGIGVRVFSDPRWSAGRTMFSQYGFHQTDLRCDQRPPKHEPYYWQHTTMGARASGELPRAVREQLGCQKGLADLTVSYLRADRKNCAASIDFIVRVGNGGTLTVPANVPVDFSYAAAGAAVNALGTAFTTKSLAPGQYEDVLVTATPPPGGPLSLVAQVDPKVSIADQNPSNNIHAFTMPSCEGGNLPPVFTTTPTLRAFVGHDYAYVVGAEDPDADPVTLSLTSAPVGMTLLPSGLLTWNPAVAQIGSHLISLKAADNRGGAAVQEFVVVVAMPDITPSPQLPELANFVMSVSTDALNYAPASVANVTVSLENQELFGRAGKLTLIVRDPTGTQVATLVSNQEILFTGKATQQVAATFDIGFLPPGEYKAEGRYVESGGQYVQDHAFNILPSSGLVAAVQTNRISYGPRDHALITTQIRNTGVNESLVGVVTVLEVLNPSNAVVFTATTPAQNLTPNTIDQRLNDFAINSGVDGHYTARLTVTRPNAPATVATRTFLVASAPHLAGIIDVNPNPVQRGTVVTIAATLTNSGNAAFVGDAHLKIVNPGVPSTVVETTVTVSLPIGASTTVSAPFDTTPIASGPYLAVVDILPVGLLSPNLLNLSKPFAIVSSGAPVVTVSVPTCTNTNVIPVVTVTGAGIVSQSSTLDGLPYAGAPVSAEGTHVLIASATNADGATGTASATFIIDKTAPVATVSGVANGATYATNVTPTIAYADAHIATSSTLLDAVSFASGTVVSSEGNHNLQASASDCAGNTVNSSTTFTIDKTPPVIAIDGVVSCGQGNVTPVITITEAHPQTQSFLLDGNPWAGTPVTTEGPHVVQVTVTDMAGSTATKSVNFIIDRTAPQLTLAGVTDGGNYAMSVAPVFAATDANLVSSAGTLDGAAFTSGTVVSSEGAHLLALSAQDCAGNLASASANFLIDRSAPVISISVPACGNQAAVPSVSVVDAHLLSQSFTIDGTVWNGSPIGGEGQHVLLVTAVDAAGNTSSASANFIIDTVAPTLLVSGVANAGSYATSVSPVFSASDAYLVSSAATIDGTSFTSGATIAGEGSHVLVVTAQDCGGNVATLPTSFIIDRTVPVISITALACGNKPVVPVVSVTDAHLQGQTAKLDGVTWNGSAISSEGQHVFEVNAVDTAGNMASASSTFVIDTVAPVLTVSGVTNGSAYAASVFPTFSATDANLTSSGATLDANPFISGSAVSTEGAHSLVFSAQDCAGNNAVDTRGFLIDKTKPVVSITALACSQGPVTPVVTVTELNPLTDIRSLDGSPWTGGPVLTQGNHNLSVTVTDIAGNIGSSTKSFVVDTTPPEVTVTGVTEGATYPAAVTPVVSMSDTNLVSSSLILDGGAFVSGTPVSAAGAHTLTGTASDCAGLSKQVDVHFTISAPNNQPKVLLVVNTTPLSASDAALKARLESPLGYSVQVITGPAVLASDTPNKVAVVITESTDSATVGPRLKDITIPMVVMEPSLFDDFRMTGPTWATDYGDIYNVTTINVLDRIHPLAAGKLGVTTISTVPTKIEWGAPAAAARKIASIASPADSRMAIFSYKKGNAMFGGTAAPARRVGFFPGRDNPGFFNMAGWQLFDAAVKWAISKKPEALLLVGSTPLSTSDQKLKARLEGKGYEVLVQTPTYATEPDARGVDLIFVSESVLSTDLGAMFKNTAAPLIMCEPSLLDDMGMTGPTWATDYGDIATATQISIVSASHAMAGGLTGNRTVAAPATKLVWGKPNGNAAKVATIVGQAQQSTIFGYASGVTMVSGTAPARRVGWFAGRDLADALTADGWILFDAAVLWANPGSAQ